MPVGGAVSGQNRCRSLLTRSLVVASRSAGLPWLRYVDCQATVSSSQYFRPTGSGGRLWVVGIICRKN